MQNLIALFESGGFVMYPLLICSLAIWAVIFERSWRFRSLSRNLEPFYSKAVELALKNDRKDLERHCLENGSLPTSRVISEAIHRLGSDNVKVRKNWLRAVERKRLAENQDLKKGLWVLGTIGSAAPFIGLFGTVLGILQSFGDIARTGKGGFAVVAGGISEALIATAAGIVVAVIAVMAFNTFQTRWSALVLRIRLQTEEFLEMLSEKSTEEVHGA